MKFFISAFITGMTFLSCTYGTKDASQPSAHSTLEGTWKLLTGTLIENGDTTITDYTKNVSFIKIINNSHFAFLQHDLGKDSTKTFVAGGGTYTLHDHRYTEHLEYCNAREWEGNNFDFTVTFNGDTLVQQGIEKVQKAGVNRLNIEKYIRLEHDRSNL